MPSSSGSSPQARGTRWMQVGHHLRNRFIPAGAGNTDLGKAPEIKGTVHPRRRGEHIAGLGAPNLRTGSSPQARGTRSVWQPVATQNRFIPAGAGNTLAPSRQQYRRPVHPRRRGEHKPVYWLYQGIGGSSPQARGTLGGSYSSSGVGRFIPAGAGNTFSDKARWQHRPVHPRRRGEHTSTYLGKNG